MGLVPLQKEIEESFLSFSLTCEDTMRRQQSATFSYHTQKQIQNDERP